jgi:FkbM family methyltransferase
VLTSSMRQMQVSFHCIEPLGSTYNALKRTSEFFGLEKIGFQVYKIVISNSSGTMWFPRGKPGTEYLGAYACSDSIVKNCVKTKMLTLDAFISKYLQKEVAIDVLTIDTEGYDFRVLRGASNILRRIK